MTNFINQPKYKAYINNTSFYTYVTKIDTDGQYLVDGGYEPRHFRSVKAAERSVTKYIHSQD